MMVEADVYSRDNVQSEDLVQFYTNYTYVMF